MAITALVAYKIVGVEVVGAEVVGSKLVGTEFAGAIGSDNGVVGSRSVGAFDDVAAGAPVFELRVHLPHSRGHVCCRRIPPTLSSLHMVEFFVLQSTLSAAKQGGATVVAMMGAVGCLVINVGGESVANVMRANDASDSSPGSVGPLVLFGPAVVETTAAPVDNRGVMCELVGELVGNAVGTDVVGEPVVNAVGTDMVGEPVVNAVGTDVVGDSVGLTVGADVVALLPKSPRHTPAV